MKRLLLTATFLCCPLLASSISGTITADCFTIDAFGHGQLTTVSQTTSTAAQSPCADPRSRSSVILEYGHLFGFTWASGTIASVHSSVDAAYADAVTVTGASGILRFTLEATGTSLWDGPLIPRSAPNLSRLVVNGNTISLPPIFSTGYPPATNAISFDQPFISGTPTNFWASLFLSAANIDQQVNRIDQYLRIQVLDGSGSPLTGATAAFESGTSYGATIQPTITNPEPGTLVMMGAGLLALLKHRHAHAGSSR